MKTYKTPDEEKVQRINRVQRECFNELVDLFDPPLPEGVPERLDQIVASAHIARGEVVLDIGTGTGILVPIIHEYDPAKIFACDLSDAMLARLREQYEYAETILADARDITLLDASIDVVFMNACYPNIVDKKATFTNISRMVKQGGRMVISHPMGKSFIDTIREESPFPLDDFPERSDAETLIEPYGFDIKEFIDEPKIYILKATFQSLQ